MRGAVLVLGSSSEMMRSANITKMKRRGGVRRFENERTDGGGIGVQSLRRRRC